MILLDLFLSHIGFALLSLVLLGSPWLFGAWEMWWFWPFAVLLFVATICFAVRLLLRLGDGETAPRQTSALVLALTFLPFLAYALVRLFLAPVYMDAERSVLLHLTAFLVGIQVLFGLSHRQRTWLFALLLANLYLIAAYGLANHILTGNRVVMWAQGYPQYVKEVRATGPYFCPDHFAGAMEYALCLCLGLLLCRNRRWPLKAFAAALAVAALAGVLLSKSRGGGLTVLVIAAATLLWGFAQWRPVFRWAFRSSAAGALCVCLLLTVIFAQGYVNRFAAYFGYAESQGKPWPERKAIAIEKIERSARGTMISGALRAWRTAPAWGIGPGMHQNLWPRFAATPDGDRESGTPPTRLNNLAFSYEVHSDWVQLLEEYGLVGLLLFLLPVATGLALLLLEVHREMHRSRDPVRHGRGRHFHLVLAALLVSLAMAFHSLGDFNLQIPANTWMLAAIVALGLSYARRPLGDAAA